LERRFDFIESGPHRVADVFPVFAVSARDRGRKVDDELLVCIDLVCSGVVLE
jgi:hypothetical protein